MKLYTSLCAIVAVVSAVKQEVFKIPTETSNKLQKIAMACAEEFNADPINISKLGDGTLPRDEATNNLLRCYAVKVGFVDEDGHIIVEKLSSVIGEHPLVKEFKETVAKCNDVTKENAVATTVAMHDCFSKTSPILFEF